MAPPLFQKVDQYFAAIDLTLAKSGIRPLSGCGEKEHSISITSVFLEGSSMNVWGCTSCKGLVPFQPTPTE